MDTLEVTASGKVTSDDELFQAALAILRVQALTSEIARQVLEVLEDPRVRTTFHARVEDYNGNLRKGRSTVDRTEGDPFPYRSFEGGIISSPSRIPEVGIIEIQSGLTVEELVQVLVWEALNVMHRDSIMYPSPVETEVATGIKFIQWAQQTGQAEFLDPRYVNSDGSPKLAALREYIMAHNLEAGTIQPVGPRNPHVHRGPPGKR